MNRDHLYRGKNDDGEWVYGNLIETKEEYSDEIVYAILEKTAEHRCCGEYCDDGWHSVIKETVGEYTGLTDKNSNKIFEGDILVGNSCGEKIVLGVVEYGTGTFDSGIYRYTGFYYKTLDGSVDHTNLYQRAIEEYDEIVIIGNIHDNPELLTDKT